MIQNDRNEKRKKRKRDTADSRKKVMQGEVIYCSEKFNVFSLCRNHRAKSIKLHPPPAHIAHHNHIWQLAHQITNIWQPYEPHTHCSWECERNLKRLTMATIVAAKITKACYCKIQMNLDGNVRSFKHLCHFLYLFLLFFLNNSDSPQF